jgi:hypothetical protein
MRIDENVTMRPPLSARIPGVQDPRAGHHYVRWGPERLLGVVEERAHSVRVRHVLLDGHGTEPPRGELCDELVGLGQVERVVDHDARTEGGEVSSLP